MIVKCQICNKEFKTHKSRTDKGFGKYCSRKCSGIAQRNRITLTCLHCGQSFELRVGCTKGRKYCSAKCYKEAKQLIPRSERTEPYRRPKPFTAICAYCENQFPITAYEYNARCRKYCSRECAHLARTTRTLRKCEVCHGKFEVHLSHLNRNGGRFCSLSCRYTYMVGENAGFWKGGDRSYPAIFNESLKEFIRERDGRVCQLCECLESCKAHDVHHIDYDKSNSQLNNLITLCESCHGHTNANRAFWQHHFKSMMKGRATWKQLSLSI